MPACPRPGLQPVHRTPIPVHGYDTTSGPPFIRPLHTIPKPSSTPQTRWQSERPHRRGVEDVGAQSAASHWPPQGHCRQHDADSRATETLRHRDVKGKHRQNRRRPEGDTPEFGAVRVISNPAPRHPKTGCAESSPSCSNTPPGRGRSRLTTLTPPPTTAPRRNPDAGRAIHHRHRPCRYG